MKALWTQFTRDEAGFVVSSELVLVLTIAVYCYNGLSGCKAATAGSAYHDCVDQCDRVGISCNNPPVAESSYHAW